MIAQLDGFVEEIVERVQATILNAHVFKLPLETVGTRCGTMLLSFCCREARVSERNAVVATPAVYHTYIAVCARKCQQEKEAKRKHHPVLGKWIDSLTLITIKEVAHHFSENRLD